MNENAIEIKPTSWNEGMSKNEIIYEVAQMTNMTQADVRDILNAFTDVAEREMLITGVFRWPGLPTVTRTVRKNVRRYQKDIDKTLLYPETAYLTSTVPDKVKKLHRNIIRQQNNLKNNTTSENWWEPYFYCDGDWRKNK